MKLYFMISLIRTIFGIETIRAFDTVKLNGFVLVASGNERPAVRPSNVFVMSSNIPRISGRSLFEKQASRV